MEVLRTPDERFDGLPGFGYGPNYVTLPDGDGGSLRVHYLDEGPAEAEVVLCMHGEPSWSFLYRHMVPVLTRARLRVVAPDLVGFGRSDKPADRADYSYARHVEWMRALIDQLDLRRITLVGQDWGGLIGLRLVAADPDRFSRVVAANTFLPTGDQPATEAFLAWRQFSQDTPEFNAGRIVSGGCSIRPDPAVVAAYDAPFPDETYKAGARAFPLLVPITPDDPAAEDNRRAWQVLAQFDRPFLTAFSDGDPVTRGGERTFQRVVPGAREMDHVTIEGAGHFLQEDRGPELAQVVVDLVRRTRRV